VVTSNWELSALTCVRDPCASPSLIVIYGFRDQWEFTTRCSIFGSFQTSQY